MVILRRNTRFKTECVENNLTRKIDRKVRTVAWARRIIGRIKIPANSYNHLKTTGMSIKMKTTYYMRHMAFISLLFFFTFSLFFNGPKCPLLLQDAEAQGIKRWYRLIQFKIKLCYLFCITKHYNVFQCRVSA